MSIDFDGVIVRPFEPSDIGRAIALWRASEGIGLNESDTPAALTAFLLRNAGSSAVAVDAGVTVGAVLCGHDGRRGALHHLAVASSHRRRGIGCRLVDHCFARLAAASIPRCNIYVYRDNDEGNAFWARAGWSDQPTWKVMQKVVDGDSSSSC